MKTSPACWLLCICALVVSCCWCMSAYGIAGKDVLAALDNPSDVEFIQFEYFVQKLDSDGWPVYDDDTGEPVYSVKPTVSQSSTRWVAQSKLDKKTYPQTGTCLRSASSVTMSSSRIVLRVYGPGTFALRIKTASESGDCLNLYVDGDIAESYDGYEKEYVPQFTEKGGDLGESDWNEIFLSIPGGKAEAGSQKGTYWHEIIIEYAKDESTEDGPVKPVFSDYDGDREWYQEDLDTYNAEMPYYNDCVWIDAGFIPLEENEDYVVTSWATVWAADAPYLEGESEEDVLFVDSCSPFVDTNAEDFGYTVRYTLDGSEPKSTSPLLDAQTKLKLTESCMLRAAVFNGKTAVSAIKPIAVSYVRQAAAPVLTLLEEQSGADARVYSMTTTTPDGTILYRLGQDAPWQPYQGTPISVDRPVELAAKTVPQGQDARESDTVAVLIESAPAAEVTAVSGGKPYVSGTLLMEGASVTFSCAEVDDVSVFYRTAETEPWRPVPFIGKTVNQSGVVQFRTEQDGKLADESVSCKVFILTDDCIFTFKGERPLVKGWNLVSVPVDLIEEHQAALASAFTAMFEYDGTTLVPVTEMKPLVGYFCYVPDPAAVNGREFYGLPVSSRQEGRGWQLVGVPEACDADGWTWDGTRFVPVKSMVPGLGYFILK